MRRAMFVAGPVAARTQYQCKRSDETARFRPEYMQAFRIALLPADQRKAMLKIIWLDPSFSAKETSDFKAVVKLGIIPGRPEVYCLDAWLRQTGPNEAAAAVIRMWEEDPDAEVCIEANSGATDAYTSVFTEISRGGQPIPRVLFLWTSTAKEIDICRWEGEFAQGHCYFDPTQPGQAKLIEQFEDYPEGHDDGPDAWSKARKRLVYLVETARPAAPDPTRADLLREAGIEKWNTADNEAIWQEARW